MRIFGADIGLKNLSYCIIEIIDDKLSIIEWELINLCSDELKCCKILRGGKQCDKISKYTDNENHYCTAHKTAECKKIKEKDKDNLFTYGRNLYMFLDNHPNVLTCDQYVIENQPALKNPKMKSMSMILYSYFIHHNKSNLLFIQPKQKLKIADKEIKEIISNSKNKYKTTKDLGIKSCEYILDKQVINKDEFLEKFNQSKKKDDLSDSFLHAYVTYYKINCLKNNNEFLCWIKKDL